MAFVQRHEDALRVAARACLLHPCPDIGDPGISEQLQDVTVAGYFRLRSYHAPCSVAAVAVSRRHGTDTSTSEKPWFTHTHDVCDMYPQGQRWWPCGWWLHDLESATTKIGLTPHPRAAVTLVGRLLEKGVRDQNLLDIFPVARALEVFGKEVASDVEEAISGIRLEVRF